MMMWLSLALPLVVLAVIAGCGLLVILISITKRGD